MKKTLLLATLMLLATLTVLYQVARADDPTTTYLGGVWSNPNSWSNGVPNYSTVAIFDGVNCLITTHGCQAKEVQIKNGTGLGILYGNLTVSDSIDMDSEYCDMFVYAYQSLTCPQINGGVVHNWSGCIYTDCLNCITELYGEQTIIRPCN